MIELLIYRKDNKEVCKLVKMMMALILPGLLVVLFSRVTYSYIVGLLLTIALIVASVYKGYTDSYILIVIDAFSLTAGLWFSKKIIAQVKRKS